MALKIIIYIDTKKLSYRKPLYTSKTNLVCKE